MFWLYLHLFGLIRKINMFISKETQGAHLPQIEKAFKEGNGDTFMQKDNFASIIAVKDLDVAEMELQGYTYFMLATITREYTPAIQVPAIPIQSNKPKSTIETNKIDWDRMNKDFEKFYTLI